MKPQTSANPFRVSIRSILTLTIIFCAAISFETTGLDAAEPTLVKSSQSEKMASGKEWRQEALNRNRRIIFNNDGCDIIHGPKKHTIEAFLARRTSALAGSQVDSIFYCTNAGVGLSHRESEAWKVFSDKASPFENNMAGEFSEAGLDPLQLMVEFGKKHNIEIFSSIRMNDTHDASGKNYGPVLFKNSGFKQKHSELLLGEISKKEQTKNGAWSAANYAEPKVRATMLAYIREACENYDIDGIELDFFRHPLYFPSTTVGKKATRKECNMMTDMLRKARQAAEEIGRKRGRPILIAVRVPDSVKYSKVVGLDLRTWFKEDLVDILIVSSYFKLNDWKYSVKLGHQYGIKVYPSLDESRVRDEEAKKIRMTSLAYRGRAANVWQSGADGVYFFNYFRPKGPVWRECGDADLLKKLDKDYFASIRGMNKAAGGSFSYKGYQHVETLNPKNPKKIMPGKSATSRIQLGESWEVESKVQLKMHLSMLEKISPEKIAIRVNGKRIKEFEVNEGVCSFTPSKKILHSGNNTVKVMLHKSSKQPIKWTDLLLEVRHPKK